MESITERFYTTLFRSTQPVPDPDIPAGETSPRMLPPVVRAAITSMKSGMSPEPDKISADLLRAGNHVLHSLLVAQMTSYLQKERVPDQWRNSGTRRVTGMIYATTVRLACRVCSTSFSRRSSQREYREHWTRPNHTNKLGSVKNSAAWTTSKLSRWSSRSAGNTICLPYQTVR